MGFPILCLPQTYQSGFYQTTVCEPRRPRCCCGRTTQQHGVPWTTWPLHSPCGLAHSQCPPAFRAVKPAHPGLGGAEHELLYFDSNCGLGAQARFSGWFLPRGPAGPGAAPEGTSQTGMRESRVWGPTVPLWPQDLFTWPLQDGRGTSCLVAQERSG